MNTKPFNNREKVLSELVIKNYDLIIIGGGITGSGILLDAQSRGLQAIMFEMQDFAAGTSSRSTKLIHGGLRYLKQFEFALVAEVGRERKIVYNNGMHITRPEHMLLPIVKNGSINKIGAWFGLWLYDKLARVNKQEQRVMLSKEQICKLEPMLNIDKLLAGAKYSEYRTDDARLTIEIIKTAQQIGGDALNYIKVIGFLYDKTQTIIGVKVVDLLTDINYEVIAKVVVNASGPWVDTTDRMDNADQKPKMIPTKGVHIVVDSSKIPIEHSIYFDASDGRMVFAIPRENKVYIGTTDTKYEGDKANPLATKEDRAYLVNIVNTFFDREVIKDTDIESSWTGIRPLVKQNNISSPNAISRKDEIFSYPSGLITIAGGKLTGYRKMSEKIVDIVSKKLNKKSIKKCQTKKIKLSGGDFTDEDQLQSFIQSKIKEGIELGLSQLETEKLAYRYGTNINQIFNYAKYQIGNLAIEYQLPPILLAELDYTIEQESAITPSDFFIRRTSALYFNLAWIKKWKTPVIDYMTQKLNWDIMTKQKYEIELSQLMKEAEFAVI